MTIGRVLSPLTMAAVLNVGACGRAPTPIRDINSHPSVFADADSVLWTVGVLANRRQPIPFTDRLVVTSLSEGPDSITAIVVDTMPTAKRVKIRVRVYTKSILGLRIGPVVVTADVSIPAQDSRDFPHRRPQP